MSMSPTTISSPHHLNQNSEQEEDDISQPFFKLQTVVDMDIHTVLGGKDIFILVPDWLNTEF